MKISQRIQELEESATLAVSAKAAAMKKQGINVVGFGAGEPDFGLYTANQFQRANDAASMTGLCGGMVHTPLLYCHLWTFG